MSIAGLILAAGRGVRFGGDKRLVRLPDGRTLLEATLARHAGLSSPLWVVLRPGDEAASALARSYGAQILICEDAHLGMGHSLACGARALMDEPELDGVVVDLADMPWVSAHTLRLIRQALAEHGQAVVPLYQGRMGQPRGLPASCLAALARLRGDEGARHIVSWQDAVHVDVDDHGILQDIDRPADLTRFTALASARPPSPL
ncbi:MAG: nucleotidyltransferase family protein [Aquabacterium sp.]|nr:nucleotidyltransferase family protein [Aquabacterium sp.]